MSTGTNRKLWLIGGGLALAGVAAGLAWGLRNPRRYGERVVFGKDGGKRVLVAYASRCGSTVDVACEVGQEMARAGWLAKVAPAAEVESLAGYDAVVLGSGIRAGKPYAAATQFAARFAEALQTLPTAVFCVSLSAALPDEVMRAEGQRYADEFGQAVGARMVAALPGVNNPGTMAPILGFLLSHESVYEGMDLLAPGDYRDLETERRWAASAAKELS